MMQIYVPILLLLLAIVGLSVASLLKINSCTLEKQAIVSVSASPRKLSNPGCSATEQAACTQMAMSGACGGKCVSCVDSRGFAKDPEGEGCVPKSCADKLGCF